MGLDMIKRIILLAPILINLSCMKKQNGTEPVYGQQADVKDVQAAVAELFVPRNLQPKVGEFWSYDTVYYIDRANPTTRAQTSYTVTAMQDTTDAVNYTYQRKGVTYDGSGKLTPDPDFQDTIPWKKAPASDASAIGSSSSTTATNAVIARAKSDVALLAAGITPKDTGSTFTYHNLDVQRGTIPVPDSVKAKPGCGGLATCDSINFLSVAYDRVEWTPDGKSKILRLKLINSKDLPWMDKIRESFNFPSQVLFCVENYVETSPGSGQFAALMGCEETRDFSFGQ